MKNIFLTLIFALFLISFLLGRSDTTRAGIDRENIRYTSVKVEYGDSLESISSEYNNMGISPEEYKKRLIKMNSMESEKVHPGCYIVVVYKDER